METRLKKTQTIIIIIIIIIIIKYPCQNYFKIWGGWGAAGRLTPPPPPRPLEPPLTIMITIKKRELITQNRVQYRTP